MKTIIMYLVIAGLLLLKEYVVYKEAKDEEEED